MKLFKKKYNVCVGCNVLFKPPEHYEKRWCMWCATCRKPVMEKDLKRDAVVQWAGENFERLYDTMKKDTMKKERAETQKSYSSFVAGPQAAGRQGGLNQYSNLQHSDFYSIFGGK